VIINIDKPIGWTSFDVVKKVKNITNHKKVGHGGTLDPFASGVLVLGTEKDTKKLSSITNSDKSYIAELHLGKLTNTLDTEGDIIEEGIVPDLNEKKIVKVLDSFLGDQKQRPPMFSAKKHKGVRLYKLARKKIEVHRNELDIIINDISLVSLLSNKIIFNVDCSKGTYIRVLGSDIARSLGTIGYLTNLKRTRVGDFSIEDSVSIDKFSESNS
jgi:tRNA pseudouridine55 synthase